MPLHARWTGDLQTGVSPFVIGYNC